MATQAQETFRLGSWRIEPARGAIVGPGGDTRHVEPKVMEVLVRLADDAGKLVAREELLESVWTRHVAADQLLTRAVSELRRALDDPRSQPKYIETVPKRGYRLIAPLGAAAPQPTGEDSLIPSRRSITYMLAAVLAIVVSALTYSMLGEDNADAPEGAALHGSRVAPFGEPTTSIAVLPFANISEEPANDYLSDGLTEEIRNLLARSSNLKVIGRTSSFAFKGRHEDVRAIGEKLGVRTVLEGSVRKSGDRLRITAQLIDVADGSHIWSNSYDRRMKDIFELQDEVAKAIFDSLRVYVASYPSRGEPTADAEAYARFLKARVALNVQDEGTAESLLLEAVELDPEFAEAWELLAHVHWIDPMPLMSLEERQLRVRDAAGQALAIDPDLVLARALLYEADSAYTWADAIDAGVAALRAQPNDPVTLRILSWNLMITGYLEEGRRVAARFTEIDPLTWIAHVRQGSGLMGIGRREAAIAEMEIARQLNPGGEMEWFLGVAYIGIDEDEKGIPLMQTGARNLLQADAEWVREIVTGARRAGNDPAFLDQAIPRVLERMTPEQVEFWRLSLNQFYLYFDLMDRYYEFILAAHPDYRKWSDAIYYIYVGALRRDRGFFAHPKYLEIAERMGFIDVWERRGAPDYCRKRDDQWICQ